MATAASKQSTMRFNSVVDSIVLNFVMRPAGKAMPRSVALLPRDVGETV